MASTSSSTLGAGMASFITSSARSCSRPVGSPFSRTMTPPGGFGVSREMPASFNAAELATPMWPQQRPSQTG